MVLLPPAQRPRCPRLETGNAQSIQIICIYYACTVRSCCFFNPNIKPRESSPKLPPGSWRLSAGGPTTCLRFLTATSACAHRPESSAKLRGGGLIHFWCSSLSVWRCFKWEVTFCFRFLLFGLFSRLRANLSWIWDVQCSSCAKARWMQRRPTRTWRSTLYF